MKLKTKLIVAFSTIFIILIIISGAVIYTLSNQKLNMETIVHNNYERVSLAHNIKFNIQKKARLIREYVLENNEYLTLEEMAEIHELMRESTTLFQQLHSVVSNDKEVITLIEQLVQLNNTNNGNIERALRLMEANQYNDAKNLIFFENAQIRQKLVVEIDRLFEIEEAAMDDILDSSLQTYHSTIVLFIVLLSVSFIIVLVITSSVMKSFSKSINSVRNVMLHLPKQTFVEIPRIDAKLQNEFDDVAQAYNEMATALEKFARDEKNLQDSLREENWIKTKYAEVATSFQGAQKLNAFSSIFVSKIAFTVEATYGVFYFKNEHGYSKTGSYAATNEVIGEETIKLGDGLVGQCALNNQVIHIDHLPSEYIKTKSGLGSASPTSLIILPIEFEGEVLAVLELAKFEPFLPLQQKLLEQICTSVGPNLNRILYGMEIEKLLAESQSLTEELQAQSEELQQQQEELKTINEDLYKEIVRSDEKTNELKKIKSDLEEKNKEILLTSKYKTEFLANMSHELRTPLNSMLILSEILSENNEANLTEKQMEYAQTIHTAGKDLLILINDILDLSKVESGKLEIYPEEVAVDEIKAFVERQFSPIAKRKGLSFDIIIDRFAPKILITDDQRLKQIIKNLLSNAFKFTNRGQVTLHIKQGTNDHKLIFSVIDTGIGIPKNKLQTIFEAFSQVDGTTSRKYGGTGLGLSISRELAQLLDGYIEVSSEEGVGSTFSLFLPDLLKIDNSSLVAASVEGEGIEVADPPHMKEEELENKTVLIVDDDMRNVFALTSLLEKEKMNVLFAENGVEAVKKLQEASIDIILMDIMMPKMNGYETMIEIRKHEDWKDIPIIALTAKAMKTDRQKCINAGASDYISKPVDLEQLLSLMKVWLFK